MEIFLSLCLGVGLAACSGFRVFVPLLLSSLALHFGFVSGAAGFEWMGSWVAIAILSTATVLEIGGYYIPWVDNLLDTIATPAAFAAGTLLTTSFIEIDNPILQWGLGLIMGGGTAGFIQAGTSIVRLASTKFSGGVANPIMATFENILSVVFSFFTFWFPIVAFVFVVLFITWLLRKILTRKSKPAI
ncbi:DUF4126 domain-containing protein [Runella slithyformis]|uniref:DUF4126 domain-containing protein n=1 Tax=Runella slithyformis (strain ATCC 29530 / DSM 19594 / LMG 11500 / NCIMB 11436 / LSU 4) TaxID=761193 RepID=A0A7U3ZP72_RUNSL|nr:DUF4126 domain-containing protein [Runella slithyformis]AEI50827.1 hypothetical protein Runsl_4505 [Runella slithyformis DSM 19594]